MFPGFFSCLIYPSLELKESAKQKCQRGQTKNKHTEACSPPLAQSKQSGKTEIVKGKKKQQTTLLQSNTKEKTGSIPTNASKGWMGNRMVHPHQEMRAFWGLSGQESSCQRRGLGLDPWIGKTPLRRKWHPTPVFLPGESHGQRAWQARVHGVTRVRHDLGTKQQTKH